MSRNSKGLQGVHRLPPARSAYWAILLFLLAACGKPSAGPPPEPVMRLPLFGELSVSPSAASGRQAQFSVSLHQFPGQPAPEYVGLLISHTSSAADGCHVFMRVSTATARLANDSGSGARELPPGATLTGARCELLSDSTSLSRTPSGLEARFSLRFPSSFAGRKNLYLSAENAGFRGTSIRLAGEFEVK